MQVQANVQKYFYSRTRTLTTSYMYNICNIVQVSKSLQSYKTSDSNRSEANIYYVRTKDLLPQSYSTKNLNTHVSSLCSISTPIGIHMS